MSWILAETCFNKRSKFAKRLILLRWRRAHVERFIESHSVRTLPMEIFLAYFIHGFSILLSNCRKHEALKYNLDIIGKDFENEGQGCLCLLMQ